MPLNLKTPAPRSSLSRRRRLSLPTCCATAVEENSRLSAAPGAFRPKAWLIPAQGNALGFGAIFTIAGHRPASYWLAIANIPGRASCSFEKLPRGIRPAHFMAGTNFHVVPIQNSLPLSPLGLVITHIIFSPVTWRIAPPKEEREKERFINLSTLEGR